MPEIGEKFYRSTLVSPDVAPGNDGGGEEYMAKVKTLNQRNGEKLFWSHILVLILKNSKWMDPGLPAGTLCTVKELFVRGRH